MPAQRHTFDSAVEGLIYWDTTFTIAFFEDIHRYHRECLDFARRLERESVLSLSSDFTQNELAFHIMKSALTVGGERTGRYWLDVKRENPELLLATIPIVEARRVELDRLTLQLPIGESVKPHAFALMRRYPLLPTDAYHIATALESGVTAFATLDADFLQVDGTIVYTCVS